MLKQMNKFIFLCAILLAPIYQAQANLIISPMRIVLEGRDRTESIVVINSGKETKTYRLEWQQKIVKPEGGYRNLTPEEIKTFPIASSMLRMSPKQVTLAPNERQVIKLSLRKPKNLADGEYRSHILFRAIPRNDNTDDLKAGLQITMIMSYTMPVVVRHGNLYQSTEIKNIELSRIDNKTKLKIMLSHSGTKSIHGNIAAYFTPKKGGNRKEVARRNSLTLFSEVTNLTVSPSFFGEKLTPGKLEVIYSNSEGNNKDVIARRTFQITANMLN